MMLLIGVLILLYMIVTWFSGYRYYGAEETDMVRFIVTLLAMILIATDDDK